MSSTTCGMPVLKKGELAALRQNRLELHCMQMRLEQTSDDGKVFSGPGVIKQRADGRLEFTLYAREVTPLDEIMQEISDSSAVEAGQITPDSLLFRLSATDANGREWTSNHIHPDKRAFEGGTLCTGALQEIAFIKDMSAPTKRDYLDLEISEDIEIPVNTPTVVREVVGCREKVSSSLNVLKFETTYHEYTLQKDTNSLRIHADANNQPLVDDFEMRLTETLQFVVARPISWSVMEKRTAGRYEIRIRTTRTNELRSRIGAPIAIGANSIQWFCAIFEKYMAFVLARQFGGTLHPISAQMRAICHASMGAIEAEALALSVAVESILTYVHTSKYELSPEESDWIEKAKKYFSTWGGPCTLSKRAIGLLSNLHSPSTSMRLAELVEIGAITDQQKQAWERLRHKLAHGEMLGSASLQEFLDSTHRLLVLFYHLVFYAIGYTGKYTDYAHPGWPPRDYMVSPIAARPE